MVEKGDLDSPSISSQEKDATDMRKDVQCSTARSNGDFRALVIFSIKTGMNVTNTDKEYIQGVRIEVIPKVGVCDAWAKNVDKVGAGNLSVRWASEDDTKMES